MQDQVFYRLTCNDEFSRVGADPPEWDSKSLHLALGRAAELASDPAKGNKISDGGIEEAAVALTAEHHSVFLQATRETSGSAEFIDDQGVAWDVKSPLSPPPGQNWAYSPDHQLVKIRHDLSQGDRVLFNLSRVNDKDRDDTLNLLKAELTCEERSKLVILTDPEVGNGNSLSS
jgi:hypothetical protein